MSMPLSTLGALLFAIPVLTLVVVVATSPRRKGQREQRSYARERRAPDYVSEIFD
jgi:hypothetical protein